MLAEIVGGILRTTPVRRESFYDAGKAIRILEKLTAAGSVRKVRTKETYAGSGETARGKYLALIVVDELKRRQQTEEGFHDLDGVLGFISGEHKVFDGLFWKIHSLNLAYGIRQNDEAPSTPSKFLALYFRERKSIAQLYRAPAQAGH